MSNLRRLICGRNEQRVIKGYYDDYSENDWEPTLVGTYPVFSEETPFPGETHSLQFSQAGCISYPRGAGVIDTGPFCMDVVFKLPVSFGTTRFLLDNSYWHIGQNAGWRFRIETNNKVILEALGNAYNTSTIAFLSNAVVTRNVFQRVTLNRDAQGQLRCWINGVKDTASPIYVNSLDKTSNGTKSDAFRIGSAKGDNVLYHYSPSHVVNARVVVGNSVYSDESPPGDGPLELVPGTQFLLACRI